ncbi:MAG: PQQ-binding-like beta-propeller repeat protein [Terriglobia bacterium]
MSLPSYLSRHAWKLKRIWMGLLITLLMGSSLCVAADADWPQWGGPHRNFVVESGRLAISWPSEGPARLWERELGDGYSGIAVSSGRLYTMLHRGNQEVVVSLDASNGKTIWEYPYDVTYLDEMNMDTGPGPHSTPLLVGSYVFTTGTTGRVHCVDSKSGKMVWSRDLFKEFGGTILARGYSSSPIAYQQSVIVTTGGPGHALVAFHQKDGSVVWQKQDFLNSHSSPTLIKFKEQDQLVGFMAKMIVGIDPANGDLLWNVPHELGGDFIVFTPLWTEDNLLFFSSAYGGGSRLLQLSKDDGKAAAKELWFNNKMRIHHGNAIRVGGLIFGSSGDFGPSFMTAIEVASGKILWQDRSFAKSMLLYADGKFILLDEEGALALVQMDSQGLKIISKTEILKSKSRTPPSLVGTKLYLRDRKTMVALDLK